MLSREEHLEQCKQRVRDDLSDAKRSHGTRLPWPYGSVVVSFINDLKKHPETEALATHARAQEGLDATAGGRDAVLEWVESFE